MNQVVRNVVTVILVVIVALVAYAFLTMPDKRSATDKIGDAVHALPDGVDKAGRALESRTPGEKLGDTIKDNTDSR